MNNPSMINYLRVGFPVLGSSDWMGGFTYIELLVKALASLPREERPQLFLIINDHTLKGHDNVSRFLSCFDDIIYIGKNELQAERFLKQKPIHFETLHKAQNFLDCFYPVLYDLWTYRNGIASIFDFQYYYLPDFFSEKDLFYRRADCERIARDAHVVIFNSVCAENDFKMLFPESKAITHALPFHVLHNEECYLHDPVEIQNKYHLPDAFLICCNQFWAHKDHGTLFEAIANLKSRGMPIHLVCTGMTGDYRAPEYFPSLKKKIEQLDITELIHILGFIPRSDQLQLMRRSLAVIQPSLFEGWSTVVEDARALGKTIIMADLPVNIEQSPRYSFFYPRGNAHALSEQIALLLPELTTGPDTAREELAKREGENLVRSYAMKFCSIVLESYALFSSQRARFFDELEEANRQLRSCESRCEELSKRADYHASFRASLKTVVAVIAMKLHMFNLLRSCKPFVRRCMNAVSVFRSGAMQGTADVVDVDTPQANAVAIARTFDGGLSEQTLRDLFVFGGGIKQAVCISPDATVLQAAMVMSLTGTKVVCIEPSYEGVLASTDNFLLYRGSLSDWISTTADLSLVDTDCIMLNGRSIPVLLDAFNGRLFENTRVVIESVQIGKNTLRTADAIIGCFSIYNAPPVPALLHPLALASE